MEVYFMTIYIVQSVFMLWIWTNSHQYFDLWSKISSNQWS